MSRIPEATDIERVIGVRIRLRRTEFGMSQEDLAGILSTLLPRHSTMRAALSGGAAVLGEGIRAYVYPAFATAVPGRFTIMLVLALAIGASVAAAGSSVQARLPFRAAPSNCRRPKERQCPSLGGPGRPSRMMY